MKLGTKKGLHILASLAWEIATSPIVVYGRSAAHLYQFLPATEILVVHHHWSSRSEEDLFDEHT